ncbi:MAG: hypothetical protein AMXMBFR84_36690 [Candidatus Hydrogenedentota bacterium]
MTDEPGGCQVSPAPDSAYKRGINPLYKHVRGEKARDGAKRGKTRLQRGSPDILPASENPRGVSKYASNVRSGSRSAHVGGTGGSGHNAFDNA